MRVRDILDVQNNKMPNMEKATLLTKLLKARARRYNPKDTEDPQGWNAGPYPGSVTSSMSRGAGQ